MEIDQLTDKLKQAYVREDVPINVATKLANKAAIQSLIAASIRQETKMLLKVGKFDSLGEALNIFVENENINIDQNASILQFNKNKFDLIHPDLGPCSATKEMQRCCWENGYCVEFGIATKKDEKMHELSCLSTESES